MKKNKSRAQDTEKRLPNSFKFTKFDTIGEPDADDDSKFLNSCFVDIGHLERIRDMSDIHRIIVGRTGSGKTALVQRLSAVEKRTIRIKPDNLALTYLSNSTILTYLDSIGVTLDPFYKLLWRHVFACEIIKLNAGKLSNQAEQTTWIDNLLSKFSRSSQDDKAKKRGIQYMEEWNGKFWETTEVRIQQITDTFSGKMEAQLGTSIDQLKLNLGTSKSSSTENVSEIAHKARNIINDIHANELNNIVETINQILDDDQKKYFIVVDGLDEAWVDDKIRYKLILQLINAAKDFKTVRNMKVIIVLRKDLIQRVFRLTRSSGHQQEKYDSLIMKLRWTKKDLIELLDKRVAALITSRNPNRTFTHTDVLPAKIDDENIDDYIFKIANRPRDVIKLFNCCIDAAIDSPKVSPSAFKHAVGIYSQSRYEALLDEWSADFPDLGLHLELLRNRSVSFKIRTIEKRDVEDQCLRIASEIDPEFRASKLFNLAISVAEANIEWGDYLKALFFELYRIGMVSLKINPYEKPSISDEDAKIISATEISSDSSVSLHPMYHRALGSQYNSTNVN